MAISRHANKQQIVNLIRSTLLNSHFTDILRPEISKVPDGFAASSPLSTNIKFPFVGGSNSWSNYFKAPSDKLTIIKNKCMQSIYKTLAQIDIFSSQEWEKFLKKTRKELATLVKKIKKAVTKEHNLFNSGDYKLCEYFSKEISYLEEQIEALTAYDTESSFSRQRTIDSLKNHYTECLRQLYDKDSTYNEIVANDWKRDQPSINNHKKITFDSFTNILPDDITVKHVFDYLRKTTGVTSLIRLKQIAILLTQKGFAFDFFPIQGAIMEAGLQSPSGNLIVADADKKQIFIQYSNNILTIVTKMFYQLRNGMTGETEPLFISTSSIQVQWTLKLNPLPIISDLALHFENQSTNIPPAVSQSLFRLKMDFQDKSQLLNILKRRCITVMLNDSVKASNMLLQNIRTIASDMTKTASQSDREKGHEICAIQECLGLTFQQASEYNADLTQSLLVQGYQYLCCIKAHELTASPHSLNYSNIQTELNYLNTVFKSYRQKYENNAFKELAKRYIAPTSEFRKRYREFFSNTLEYKLGTINPEFMYWIDLENKSRNILVKRDLKYDSLEEYEKENSIRYKDDDMRSIESGYISAN